MRWRAMNDARNRAAHDRAAVPGKGDLELLGTVVRRAVVLCGRQQRRIVAKLPVLHQRRDELVGGKTAKASVLGRHDDVEPAGGAGDLPFLDQPTQRELRRGAGHAERGSPFLPR